MNCIGCELYLSKAVKNVITRGLDTNIEAGPTLLQQAQASVFFVCSPAVLRTTVLDQRSANIFHKGPGSKYCYFRLCEPQSLYHTL